jgi:hypothetical protein
MTIDEPIQLNNTDEEDVSDVVQMLEKSFDVKFSKTAFIKVTTFGELCDVIKSYVIGRHEEGCTTQQAFYKIRTALGAILSISKAEIKPATRLEDLFPRKGRKRQITKFEKHLGLKARLLTYPDWLTSCFTIGFLLSLFAFFIDWRIAVSGIVVFSAVFRLEGKLGRELTIQAIGQLTEKMTLKHYAGMRRTKGSINRHEIVEIIKTAFCVHLYIDREYLTADAPL